MTDYKANGKIASSPLADPVSYPEFSEDFTEKFSGATGLQKRVLYRISVLEDEIPHFSGGLPLYEFELKMDVAGALMKVLPDYEFTVDMGSKRVSVGTISVSLDQ